MDARSEPKLVRAESVIKATSSGLYVNITVYGEAFHMCRVERSNPYLDKRKSEVLVQNSRGDWLRVWFYDSDVKR